MEEVTQTTQDAISQVKKETIKHLQVLLHAVQDSLQSASNLDNTK